MSEDLTKLPTLDVREAEVSTEFKEEAFTASGTFDEEPIVDYIDEASVEELAKAVAAGDYGYDTEVWKYLFEDRYDAIVAELDTYRD